MRFNDIALEVLLANTEIRLSTEKLSFLQTFLFGSQTNSTEFDANNRKFEKKLIVFEARKPTFFIPSSQEETFALNENKLTFGTP